MLGPRTLGGVTRAVHVCLISATFPRVQAPSRAAGHSHVGTKAVDRPPGLQGALSASSLAMTTTWTHSDGGTCRGPGDVQLGSVHAHCGDHLLSPIGRALGRGSQGSLRRPGEEEEPCPHRRGRPGWPPSG